MEVKVLGTGCANCRSTIAIIEVVAKSKGVSVALQKIQELREIMSYGVMATPGVVIDGKVVHERRSAACAERHAGQVPVLRQVAADEIFFLPVGHRRVANGEPADLARSRNVTLEQHRRHTERARNVVEAEARIVRR